jgi:hypothetical protein
MTSSQLARVVVAPLRRPLLRALASAAIVSAGIAACFSSEFQAPEIAQVRVDPPQVTLDIGASVRLRATAKDGEGNVVGDAPLAEWRSQAPAVATVNESGVIVAVATGTATITAQIGGATGQATITVRRVPVSEVVVTGPSLNLSRGQTAALAARVVLESGSDATDRAVAWTSSNTSVATVPATGLAVQVTAVAPGTAVIRATSEGVIGEITIVVAPDPVIGVSSEAVGFQAVSGGAAPPTQSISISNQGGGTLSGLSVGTQFTAGQPQGWLTATLGGTSAPTSVTLGIVPGTIAAGTYTATVTVSTSLPSVAPNAITVTLTVTPGPTIELDASTVQFIGAQGAANPANQTVGIDNSGGGTLGGLALGTVTYGAGQPTGWLTPTLSGATAPATITLAANISGLALGSYTASIPVQSTQPNVAPVTLNVTLDVGSGALISLSPSSVTFTGTVGGANPVGRNVAVTNGGPGALTGLSIGTITYGAGQPTGWLAATLSTTTAPANAILNATLGALPAGSYTATVPVQTNLVGVATRNIAVTFTVSAVNIVLSVTSVTMNAPNGGGNPPNSTVNVTSSGAGPVLGLSIGTITYGAGQPTGWLNASLGGATQTPAVVTLSANVSGVPSGTYTASVPVRSTNAANSPRNITVTLVVPQPQIALSSTSANFTATQSIGTATAQIINITNSGGGQLTGLARSITYGAGASNWLSATLNTTTAPATLTIQPTGAAGIARGTYTATITITSAVASNSPRTVSSQLRLIFTFNTHISPRISLIGSPGCLGSGCHSPANFTPDLSTGDVFNTMRTTPGSGTFYIVPNNLATSFMYQRIIGNGNIMPPGSPAGGHPSVQPFFQGWILDGALRN